jgi:hypothetical protein
MILESKSQRNRCIGSTIQLRIKFEAVSRIRTEKRPRVG